MDLKAIIISAVITAAIAIISGIIIAFFNKHKNRYTLGTNKEFENKVKPIVKTELVPIDARVDRLEKAQTKTTNEIKADIKEMKETNAQQVELLKSIHETLYFQLKDQTIHAIQKCLDKGFKTYEDANNIEGLYTQYEMAAKFI